MCHYFGSQRADKKGFCVLDIFSGWSRSEKSLEMMRREKYMQMGSRAAPQPWTRACQLHRLRRGPNLVLCICVNGARASRAVSSLPLPLPACPPSGEAVPWRQVVLWSWSSLPVLTSSPPVSPWQVPQPCHHADGGWWGCWPTATLSLAGSRGLSPVGLPAAAGRNAALCEGGQNLSEASVLGVARICLPRWTTPCQPAALTAESW